MISFIAQLQEQQHYSFLQYFHKNVSNKIIFHPKINSIEQQNKKRKDNSVMATKQMFNDNNYNSGEWTLHYSADKTELRWVRCPWHPRRSRMWTISTCPSFHLSLWGGEAFYCVPRYVNLPLSLHLSEVQDSVISSWGSECSPVEPWGSSFVP